MIRPTQSCQQHEHELPLPLQSQVADGPVPPCSDKVTLKIQHPAPSTVLQDRLLNFLVPRMLSGGQ